MTLEVDDKIAEYRERGATWAMLGLADIDGMLRGKFVSLEKLKSPLNKGRYLPEFLVMPAPTDTI